MQADNEERYVDDARPAGLPVVPIAVVVLLIIGAAYWYLGREDAAQAPPPPAPVEAPAPPPAPVPAEPAPAPDIPEPEPLPAEPYEPPPPPPPPLALEDSDPVVREALQPGLEAGVLLPALEQDNLIERTAALVDLTRQGRVEPKLFPVPRPAGKFPVIEENDTIRLDPAGYDRYNAHARAIAALDPATLAASFHQFRPLLEEAWAALFGG